MPRASKWYLAFGLMATIAYAFLPPAEASLVAWPVIGWSTVAAILLGIRRHRPAARGPWLLLAAGVAMFVIGDNLYSYRTYVQHAEALFPSYVDLIYLSMYPLMVAGLARLVHHRSAGRDRAGLIDAAIITAGIGLVAWVFLMAPYVRNPELSLVECFVSVAYPLGDVALLAIAIRLAFGGGRRPAAFWLLAGNIVPLLVADSLYGHMNLAGTWHEHNPVSLLWIAFYVGWGLAAVHPSMRALTAPTSIRRRAHPRRLALVGSAVLVPPIVLFAEQLQGTVNDAAAIAVIGVITFVLVMVRITGLARSLADERNEARFRALIDNASDAIVVVDVGGVVRYHTPSTEHVLGRTSASLDDRSLAHLLERPDAEQLYLLLAGTIAPTLVEWRVHHGDGGWRDLEVIASDMREVPGIDGVVLTMRDVTERKGLDAELRRQSLHDTLTHLPNRALFLDRVARALEVGRPTSTKIWVLFLDLDDFKMVNDSLGHGAGDELLVAVAARLSALHGPEDTVARFGGDEFAILVADHGPADLDQVAERVMVSFRQPFVLGTDEVTVHASIGLALGQAETDDAGDLIRNADVAMYVAKRNGKDRCEVFEASMYEAARRRLEVAGELHGAIGRGELVLHYQPVVELHNGRIVGAEALVRWQHPERGFLPPSEFIPIAETRAVIITLGRWVLNAACRQVAAWRREGIVDPEFYVTVNLSARHVQDPGVVDDVVSALRDADLPASAIVIEVTESTLIHDLERTRITLAELKRVGVRLAVDDFGTGYSSLSYLGSFPVDLVKIDKSFVDHVAKTPSGAALVRAVVELAHGLGLKAVAEGVEERDQAVALEGLGCTLAQGYLFARPLPAEGLAAAVAADHAVNAPVGAAHR